MFCGPIDVMIQTTYYPAGEGQKVRDMKLAGLSDRSDAIYRTNIQISELNALKASLAVIKFNQLRGFYR